MLQKKLQQLLRIKPQENLQDYKIETPSNNDNISKQKKSQSKNSQNQTTSVKMPVIVVNRLQDPNDQMTNRNSNALSRTNDDSLSLSYVLDFSANGSSYGRNTRRCQSQMKKSYHDYDVQDMGLINRQSLPLPQEHYEYEDSIIEMMKNKNQFQLPKVTQNSNKLMKKIKKIKQIIKVIGRFIVLYLKILPKQSVKKAIIQQQQKQFQLKKQILNFEKKIDEKVKEKFRQWTEPAFKKIFYYFQKHRNSLYEASYINEDILNDTKQIWSLNYAKFFFQNIELITRKGNIDKLIIKAMSDSLYRENNIMFSLFIARRTRFYQGSFKKLESQLLCCEFIFFDVIIPQLFELSNNLKFESFEQTIKCKMNVIELASFVQIYFMKYFKKMMNTTENIEYCNLFQRKLMISPDQNQYLSLIMTKDITLSETMIVGLKSEDYIKSLLKKREKWNKKLAALFEKTISNIYEQIEIND